MRDPGGTFDTNPDTCNLRCVMCEEHSPHSPLQSVRRRQGRPHRLMPIELVRKVVAEAAAAGGLREIIPSTMGEPLLYEHFEDILALCPQYGVRLNLTTNGTFPRLGARAAGGGNRCGVTFQLTFLKANVGELADIVRLAVDLGIDRVEGHHVWTHFREIKGQSMRRHPGAIRCWNRAVLAARQVAAEHPLPNGKLVQIDNIFPLDEEATDDLAPGDPCPFLGREAWVSAEEPFGPCCVPDAQRRTLGDFGNLHERGIMDIWNGEPYRALVATYRNRALCIGCNMRRPAGTP